MNTLTWLIRREIWEHRAIWMVPAAILVLLLAAAVTGHIALGPLNLMEFEAGQQHLESIPAEERGTAVAVVMAVIIGLFLAVMSFVGTFYALDALYADRRDRSVLFWKSMPVSDLETVLSKLLTAAVVIPLVGLLAGFLGFLVIATGVSVKLGLAGGSASLFWMPGTMLQVLAAMTGLLFTYMLWLLPVIAWLMLASAWAPRAPFLWASLPVFAAGTLENLAFGSEHFFSMVGYRLMGAPERLFTGPGGDWRTLAEGEIFYRVFSLLASPDMWLGWVAAAGLIAATIWVRRYREESI